MKNICFLFLLICTQLFAADYRKIHSIEEVSSMLLTENTNTLIIFDVDNVLITSMSAINRPVGDQLRIQLSKKYLKPLPKEQCLELQSLIWHHDKFRLIEAHTPHLIQQLQRKSIPIIALSSLGTGTFGIIPDMTDYRCRQLKTFCIDFSVVCPKGHLIFTELNEVYGNYPVYRDGILLTNWYANKKGDVLMAFLNRLNWKPKKIIFFDDMIENLESVNEKLSESNIEFVGIHYSAIHDETIDALVAEKQFEHLCKNKRWLVDHEMISS